MRLSGIVKCIPHCSLCIVWASAAPHVEFGVHNIVQPVLPSWIKSSPLQPVFSEASTDISRCKTSPGEPQRNVEQGAETTPPPSKISLAICSCFPRTTLTFQDTCSTAGDDPILLEDAGRLSTHSTPTTAGSELAQDVTNGASNTGNGAQFGDSPQPGFSEIILSVLLVLFAWRLLRRAARRSRAERGVCDDLQLSLSLAEVASGEASLIFPDVNRKAVRGASASSSCNIQPQDSLLSDTLDTSGDYVSAQSYTSSQSLDALQAETLPSSINLSFSPPGNAVVDTSTSAAFVSFSTTATVTSSSPPRATGDDQIVFASPEITSTSTPLLRSPVLPCTVRVARQLLQRGLETFATEAELRVLYKWARLVTPVHLVSPTDKAEEEYRTEMDAPMSDESLVKDAKEVEVEADPFNLDEDDFQRRQKMRMWRGRRWG